LEGKQLNAEEEFDLKWSAASLYSGTLTWFCIHFRVCLNFLGLKGASDTVRFFFPIVNLNAYL